MPSMTSGSLFAWIIGIFGAVCIVAILVTTRGRGFRSIWQLIKFDPLVRNMCIAWIVILLIQIVNALSSNPWRDTIILIGASLNVVMIVLISYILPGRLAKKRI
jgi:hypothetical protein